MVSEMNGTPIELDVGTIDGTTCTHTGMLIVGADHPSMNTDVEGFFESLRTEPRYFGPTASANPKPFPSMIEALRDREGFRLAAVEQGRVIGVVRVDTYGELFIAVASGRRGCGVGTMLGRAAVERAADLGYRRIVMRVERRSRAARRVGEQLGCTVIDLGHGRTEMILYPGGATDRRRSA